MSLAVRTILLFSLPAAILSAQSVICTTSAVPPIVRVEGLAERIGDIGIVCTGQPNATLIANFTVSMNANITNRISSGNTLTGIVFTVDSGIGPQAVLSQPLLLTPNTLSFGGVSVAFSAQGSVALNIADIRVDTSVLTDEEVAVAILTKLRKSEF